MSTRHSFAIRFQDVLCASHRHYQQKCISLPILTPFLCAVLHLLHSFLHLTELTELTNLQVSQSQTDSLMSCQKFPRLNNFHLRCNSIQCHSCHQNHLQTSSFCMYFSSSFLDALRVVCYSLTSIPRDSGRSPRTVSSKRFPRPPWEIVYTGCVFVWLFCLCRLWSYSFWS